jgi:TolB-like protein
VLAERLDRVTCLGYAGVMRSRVILASTGVLCAVLASMCPPSALAASAAERPRILVLPTKARGVGEADAQRITDAMAQRLVAEDTHSVLSMADLEKLASAESLRSMLGCDSQECVAQLSRALNADLLLTGFLGRVGNRLTLNLVLVDPRNGATRNSATAEAIDIRELLRATPGVVATLMGWTTGAARRFALPAGSKTSLAVLDLVPRGVPDDVAGNLTQVLSAELKRIDGTSVISREDIAAMLQVQETKLKAGCDDMECLAEIGGALGVDRLVTGSVGKLSGSYVVSLRLISSRHSRVEHLVTESFSGAEDQLIRAVKRAGRLLLGVDPKGVGSLTVTASEQGARIMLDGIPRGTLPMPPIQALAPGQHQLLILKSGHHDWSSDVYVDSEETTAIWAELVARPVPWYRQWWVWALTGGAGTTAVLGTILTAGVMVSGTALTGLVLLRNTSQARATME